MEWDFRRPGEETFAGILVTEVDPVSLEFIGSRRRSSREPTEVLSRDLISIRRTAGIIC
jgi:hypothetical protein